MTENIRIAIDALRVSKLRSALTILGVVIGVATVMAMAAIVQGIRDQIVNTIEVAGPTTFYVMKKFSQTPLNPENLPRDVRIRPDLSEAEAARLRSLPEIAYASLWAQALARIEVVGVRTQPMAVFGADDGFSRIQGGELTVGRWFTHVELEGSAPVVVLEDETARRLFGREQALDRMVQIGGRPLTVIGVWSEPANIFRRRDNPWVPSCRSGSWIATSRSIARMHSGSPSSRVLASPLKMHRAPSPWPFVSCAGCAPPTAAPST